MAASLHMLSLFVLLLAAAASPAVLAGGGHAATGYDEGFTHIHLYMHEKFTGLNATLATVAGPPVDSGSPTFGAVRVIDNELRAGRDRSSRLLGRFQGFIVGTTLPPSSGYLTSNVFVFTAGEHCGSTLSVQGPALDLRGSFERSLVGGTGEFRMARGYSVTKFLEYPTPETLLYEVDVFVLMAPRKY